MLWTLWEEGIHLERLFYLNEERFNFLRRLRDDFVRTVFRGRNQEKPKEELLEVVEEGLESEERQWDIVYKNYECVFGDEKLGVRWRRARIWYNEREM